MSNIALEIRYHAPAVRRQEFYTLVIIENRQPKYYVSSKEGFDEKTLTNFLHEFARLQHT